MHPILSGRIQERRLKSSEEEFEYLREQVRQKQEEMEFPEDRFEKDRIRVREISEYARRPAEGLLHEAAVLPEHEILRYTARLSAEGFDPQMDALLKILATHGIKNALSVAVRLKNPELELDFNHMLARSLAEGLPNKGLFPVEKLRHAPELVLFEIQPRELGTLEKQPANLQLTVALWEKIYSELISLIAMHESFSLEIAVPDGTKDVSIYLSMPRGKKTFAERLIASISPCIALSESRGDYNIINHHGDSAAAFAHLANHHAFSLKTHDMFNKDPMHLLLNALSKIAKYGEGASLQFVIGNEGERYSAHYAEMLGEIEKGRAVSEIIELPESTAGRILHHAFDSDPNGEGSNVRKYARHIKRKIKSPIVPVNMRIAASARDKGRARELLDELKRSFDHYGDTDGNQLVFRDIGNWSMRDFLRDFRERTFNPDLRMPLSVSELATMLHFAR